MMLTKKKRRREKKNTTERNEQNAIEKTIGSLRFCFPHKTYSNEAENSLIVKRLSEDSRHSLGDTMQRCQ